MIKRFRNICKIFAVTMIIAGMAAAQNAGAFKQTPMMPPEMPPGKPVIADSLVKKFDKRIDSLSGQLKASKSRTLKAERSQSTITVTSPAASYPRVAIIVDNPLYTQLQTEIQQYVSDVNARFPVNCVVYSNNSWNGKSPIEFRNYIRTLYNQDGITGAVLVGFFPTMMWETFGENDTSHFPVLLCYEDLDADFLDMDGNGYFDTWRNNNNRQLEIWVDLMRPFQDAANDFTYSRNVIEQTRSFLNKCHSYYQGQMLIPNRALVYANNDWRGAATSGSAGVVNLRNIYGFANVDTVAGNGNGEDYLTRLYKGYDIMNIWCHASAYCHYFDGGARSTVWSTPDLTNLRGPGGLINILWDCHGADFSDDNEDGFGSGTECMAFKYAYLGNGMVSMGVTRSDYTYGIDQFIASMGRGLFAGQSFLEVMNMVYADTIFQNGNKLIDQILVGNPFVYANANPAGQGASISGSIKWSNGNQVPNARVTAYVNDTLKSLVFSDNEGNFTIPNMYANVYTLKAESQEGLIGSFAQTVTLAASQNVSDIEIRIAAKRDISGINGLWHYSLVKSSQMVPADWNDAHIDTAKWNWSTVPFAQINTNGGTEIQFGGASLYIRKNFVLKSTAQVFVNISADNGCDLYVNGVNVPVLYSLGQICARPTLGYWNLKLDISSYCKTGENYIVIHGKDAWCGAFLDAVVYQDAAQDGPFEVTMTSDNDVNNNLIQPSFTIKNTGTNSIDLSNVKIEYYTYDTSVNASNLMCDIYYCSINNSGAAATFSKLSQTCGTANQKADTKTAFGFTSGTLGPNVSMQLKVGIHTNDWQYNFNESDDWSHTVQTGNKASYVVIRDKSTNAVLFGTVPTGM